MLLYSAEKSSYKESFLDSGTLIAFTANDTSNPLPTTDKCRTPCFTGSKAMEDMVAFKNTIEPSGNSVVSNCKITLKKTIGNAPKCHITAICSCPGLKMFVRTQSFENTDDYKDIAAFGNTSVVTVDDCVTDTSLIALIVVVSIVGLATIIGLAICLKKQYW